MHSLPTGRFAIGQGRFIGEKEGKANMETNQNNEVEDAFIQELISAQVFVSVFLKSGLQLKGTIKAVDPQTLMLDNNGQTQLIFKHIISTICPRQQSD